MEHMILTIADMTTLEAIGSRITDAELAEYSYHTGSGVTVTFTPVKDSGDEDTSDASKSQ